MAGIEELLKTLEQAGKCTLTWGTDGRYYLAIGECEFRGNSLEEVLAYSHQAILGTLSKKNTELREQLDNALQQLRLLKQELADVRQRLNSQEAALHAAEALDYALKGKSR